MTPTRILLIGATGQVGWELQRCVQALGTVIPAGRQQSHRVDLTDPDSVRTLVQATQPTIILNAAAYTAVDKAETEAELAYAVNAQAPGILAEEAQRLGALLVHYSTDYVFNGQQCHPYTEDVPTQPLGVYGSSKLAGEQAIQAVGGQYLIFRTAWVYGRRGHNFLLTMQRLARERDELRIVNDQVGAPTWSRVIAEVTAMILAQLYSPFSRLEMPEMSGIYHLTCAGETTWYHFASAILAQGERQPRLVPITTKDYPTPAQRPAYSVLSCAKLQETFGVNLPSWDQALALCLAN